MPNFKITMLIQQGTGIASGDPTATQEHIGGWSESILINAANAQAAKDAVTFGIDGQVSILALRAIMLANSGSMLGWRIQQVMPKTGKGQSFAVNYTGASGVTDIPQMAILCTIGGVGVTNVRRFSLRGIPDQYVSEGEFVPDATFRLRVNNYFRALGSYSFIGLDLGQPVSPVQSIIAATGVLTLTSAQPLWGIGDTIKISKTTFDITGQSASFKTKIKSITTTLQFVVDPAPVLDCSGGTAQKLLPLVFQIDGASGQVSRATTHKVGRPFGQYRGRRSKRKIVV